ncbi:hypothetical protein CHS0354_005069 [Potamilus streckersoni]|uniref:Uncharacterized protein n=1 Tax=Potamilus streckersoni TaxID=2493646 RepID=A0AAE0SHM6_9BIVA|nr:hypothetical protein CHS0354_005069 [Potamilus streckersoni]
MTGKHIGESRTAEFIPGLLFTCAYICQFTSDRKKKNTQEFLEGLATVEMCDKLPMDREVHMDEVWDVDIAGLSHKALREVDRPVREPQKNPCVVHGQTEHNGEDNNTSPFLTPASLSFFLIFLNLNKNVWILLYNM